jgi:hypothetical protein
MFRNRPSCVDDVHHDKHIHRQRILQNAFIMKLTLYTLAINIALIILRDLRVRQMSPNDDTPLRFHLLLLFYD